MSTCNQCGKETGDDSTPTCVSCVSSKKIVAGILAILLGGFGIHKFYLGMPGAGLFQFLLSWICGIGAIIGIIEGVIYLTCDDRTFYETYIVGKRNWF